MNRKGDMKQNILERKIDEVISQDHLQKRIDEGGKLRIKYGVDPTSPDIHIGHAVALWKMREFQVRGHHIILVIGDYTAKIGDPSGRNKTRPMLEEKEIEVNAKTYLRQIGKILDMRKVEVQRNSKWFSHMTFAQILKLVAKFTVAQILERDDFEKRYKTGQDIGLHELMYPVMQAFDSVMVKADVEIGGTDQRFNMLAGRDLQKKMGQVPQDVITVPLLVGSDGKEKMSKSLGNAIGINEPPGEIYGKIMSIPDDLIMPYFELATDLSEGGLAMVKKELEEKVSPRDVKARLAFLITELYYDNIKAEEAARDFDEIFKAKKMPEKIAVIKIKKGGKRDIIDILVDGQLVKSRGEARRLVEQGGVRVNKKVVGLGERVEADGKVIQIGKRRFYRIKAGK